MTDNNEKNNGFKIHIEDISSVEKKVFVEISQAHVMKEFESAYAEFKKHAHLKGFRKGHVPKSLIKEQFRKPITESVAQSLIEESYKKACIENSITPISPLKLDDTNFSKLTEGEPFSYSGAFEIKPRLDMVHYDGLTVSKSQVEIKEEEIEAKLKALANNCAVLKEITEDRGTQKGDIIELEYLEQKEDWTKAPMSFEINERLPKNILEQLLNIKKGDVVKLALDKGRNVRCIAIKYKELPQLDDEFAKGLGEFKNFLELKESLKKDLLQHKEEIEMSTMYENITDQLIEKNNFMVPSALVVQEIAYYKQSAAHLHQGHDHHDHDHEHDHQHEHQHEDEKELENRAVRNLKKLILIEAIAQKENVRVEDDELNKKLETMAHNTKMDVSRLKAYYTKNNLLESMRGKLVEDKTFAFLYTKALTK